MEAGILRLQGNRTAKTFLGLVVLALVDQGDSLQKQRPRRLGIEFNRPRQVFSSLAVAANEVKTDRRQDSRAHPSRAREQLPSGPTRGPRPAVRRVARRGYAEPELEDYPAPGSAPAQIPGRPLQSGDPGSMRSRANNGRRMFSGHVMRVQHLLRARRMQDRPAPADDESQGRRDESDWPREDRQPHPSAAAFFRKSWPTAALHWKSEPKMLAAACASLALRKPVRLRVRRGRC